MLSFNEEERLMHLDKKLQRLNKELFDLVKEFGKLNSLQNKCNYKELELDSKFIEIEESIAEKKLECKLTKYEYHGKADDYEGNFIFDEIVRSKFDNLIEFLYKETIELHEKERLIHLDIELNKLTEELVELEKKSIELKFNDGRRIYYTIIPVNNVILLLGGCKNGQSSDICKAKNSIEKAKAHAKKRASAAS